MLCHLPLLLPLAGLALFFVLPFPVALALYLPIAALSVVVGQKVMAAMRRPVQGGAEGMRGADGVVVTARGRRAVAEIRGELWDVVGPEPLAPGARVVVVGLDGLTALVRRDPSGAAPPPEGPDRAGRLAGVGR